MWENTHKQTQVFNNKQPNVFPMCLSTFYRFRRLLKAMQKKSKASPVGRSDQDVVEALSQRLLEVWVWKENPAGEKCCYQSNHVT